MSGLDGLADRTGFDLIDPALARDVVSSIKLGLSRGVLFDAAPDVLTIFRRCVRAAIRKLEADRRQFDLFRRFLTNGPFEGEGPVPAELISRRLSDDETATVIRFIYYHIINAFQGVVAELLAVGPCVRVIEELRRNGLVPQRAKIYVGDMVLSQVESSSRVAKGADVHVLVRSLHGNRMTARLAGLAEVKSYPMSRDRLFGQIQRHIRRARRGLPVRADSAGNVERFFPVVADSRRVVQIGVVPASWRLPRTFRLEGAGGERGLFVDPPVPPSAEDRIESLGANKWQITLRWSHEALASAAYEMTFWLMGELGKAIYTGQRPPEWAEMTPAEAGRNAAKMMLYYAILRCRTVWESRRAIALYNSYGFGYALGANFKDKKGYREMLWFEDLKEIAAHGKTKHGGFLGA